jgi:hypothetical protein
VSRWSRRVARIKKKLGENAAGYRMPDGTVKYIKRKNVLDAMCEATAGIDTPRARVMLTAVESLGGGRLHEFAQALRPDVEGPTVQHQPTQKEKTQ